MDSQITYLSKTEKRVLKETAAGLYEKSDGVPYDTIVAAALRSLESLGLVSLRATKGGLGAVISDNGRLLLHENQNLRFAPPEGKRWVITTAISVVALIVATIAMIRTFL